VNWWATLQKQSISHIGAEKVTPTNVQTLHIAVDYKTPVYLKDIAISIGMLNKAQGQTFSEVGNNMQQPCFSHGQLCIAWRFVDVKEIIVVEHTPNSVAKDKHYVYTSVKKSFKFSVLVGTAIKSTETSSWDETRTEHALSSCFISAACLLQSLLILKILNLLHLFVYFF